jgi:hypothetical protein
MRWGGGCESRAGTHFTCFTGSKVHVLTQKRYAAGVQDESDEGGGGGVDFTRVEARNKYAVSILRRVKQKMDGRDRIESFGIPGTQFTCVTGTKLHVLTLCDSRRGWGGVVGGGCGGQNDSAGAGVVFIY